MAVNDNGKALAATDVAGLLLNWRALNESLLQLSEAAVKQLLLYEMEHQRREIWLSRLHHRFNRLRLLRERASMTSGDASWLHRHP